MRYRISTLSINSPVYGNADFSKLNNGVSSEALGLPSANQLGKSEARFCKQNYSLEVIRFQESRRSPSSVDSLLRPPAAAT